MAKRSLRACRRCIPEVRSARRADPRRWIRRSRSHTRRCRILAGTNEVPAEATRATTRGAACPARALYWQAVPLACLVGTQVQPKLTLRLREYIHDRTVEIRAIGRDVAEESGSLGVRRQHTTARSGPGFYLQGLQETRGARSPTVRWCRSSVAAACRHSVGTARVRRLRHVLERRVVCIKPRKLGEVT